MPIRITLLDGGSAGRVFDFPDSQSIITVGRHPSCDVVFPSEMTEVSRYHLAFERTLAHYRLMMQSDTPVWLDNEEAFEGDELPLTAKITLGHRKGPTLMVETLEEDALPPTQRYARHDAAARAAARVSRSNKTLLAPLTLLTVVLVGLVVLLGMLNIQNKEDVESLRATLHKQPNPGADTSLALRLREASRSVVLVVAQDEFGETPFGTAFVVGKGVLITSAHVVESIQQLGRDVRMVIRTSGSEPTDIPVTQVTIHPHYHLFEDAWRSYGPFLAGAGGDSRPLVEAGGYDLAILKVAPDSSSLLGPPLPLAPEADLSALEPGDPVGYVGFPIESAALGGVNMDDPEAQLQIGRITALTDFFLVKSDIADRHLLQHSLPVQGGVSGSPVLDQRGQVIGVISGGNLVEIDALGTRVSTGIGVNFAQRADLVRELLSGEADERTSDREAYWQKRLRRYQNEVDILLSDWVVSHGSAMPITPLIQVDGRTAHDPEYNLPAFRYSYTLPKDGWYLFLASARRRENIDMTLLDTMVKPPQTLGQDNAPDSYPAVETLGEKGNTIEVVVNGPAVSDVLLRIYWLPATK